ncbi:mannosylglycoprotein endo-beta-mannosidase-like protein [Corchorus capsularis]|uniref:Mannosylglycoprotein endo-beta-mannosidase-like protein n=1 Tax=Corchorus capsularis TaxID=210143 RepID=A0A1R3HLW1_COCAP|nr:mannosylglycoprotein endo-beta-mannosidase-like protein [Corchorus capsularis]
MGKQSLYNVSITLVVKGYGESDSWDNLFGFRKIESHIDSATRGRLFMVNGQPIFICGGNWILSDCVLWLSNEHYKTDKVSCSYEFEYNSLGGALPPPGGATPPPGGASPPPSGALPLSSGIPAAAVWIEMAAAAWIYNSRRRVRDDVPSAENEICEVRCAGSCSQGCCGAVGDGGASPMIWWDLLGAAHLNKCAI